MLNYRSILIASLFIGLNLLVSGQSLASPAGKITGTILSTMDATGYTYVEVKLSDDTIWLAGPKTELTKGESLTVNIGAPMRNFHSKTLNRDFPVIYFIGQFSDSASTTAKLPEGHKPINGSPAMAVTKKITLSKPVKRAEGGYTIAEIITKKKELSGKTVKVRGEITKFNADIMKTNWIHIIDGSSKEDMIVITHDTAKTGQVAVIEGTIALDKDFGYGYKYKLLIEDAKVILD